MFKALYCQFPGIDERLGCLIAFVLLLSLTGCSSPVTYSVADQESIHTTSQQVQFAIRVNADKANFSDLKQIVLAELDKQFPIAEASSIDTINIAIYFKGQPIWTDTSGHYKEFNCGAILSTSTTISRSTFQSYGQVASFDYDKFKSWIYCRVNSLTSDFAFSPQLMLLMIGLITMLGGTSIVLYRRQYSKKVIPIITELESINSHPITQMRNNIEALPRPEKQEVVEQKKTDKDSELHDHGIADLDFSRIKEIQQEKVGEFLEKYSQNSDHDSNSKPFISDDINDIIRRLDIVESHKTILRKIASRDVCSWSEYKNLCRQHTVMPNGAIDAINEAALKEYDEELLTTEQNKVKINLSIGRK